MSCVHLLRPSLADILPSRCTDINCRDGQKTAEVNINLGRAERYILGFSALWFTINSFLPFAIVKWTPEAAIYVGFIQIGAFAITLFFILALPAAADEMENPITLSWKI